MSDDDQRGTDSKMSDDTHKYPPPPGICDECLEQRSKRHKPSGGLVTYCIHTRTGCVFHDGMWECLSPIGEEEYMRFVEDAMDLARGGKRADRSTH